MVFVVLHSSNCQVTKRKKISSSVFISGKRQKKLRTWIPIETLPILLNSVLESIEEEERAVYDNNKIQDFLLKTVSEFGLGTSSLVSNQLFQVCREYLLSNIVGNAAFHSSFRVDFRSPVSIKSYKHFLVNTPSAKEATTRSNVDFETYQYNSENEETLDVNEQDVLNLHLGPRRLTRTLYQVLMSSTAERAEYVPETSRSSSLGELFPGTKQHQNSTRDEKQYSDARIQEEKGSTSSSSNESKQYSQISHPVVRFLPLLHFFFQSSYACSDHRFASVHSKACLLEALEKLPEKDIAAMDEVFPKRDTCFPQRSSKNQKYSSKSSCAYELARKDRILRNEEILRRMASNRSLFLQKVLLNETEDDCGSDGCGKVSEEDSFAPNAEMKEFRKVLQDTGIFCDFPLWKMLTAFVQLVKEQDANVSHSAPFYAMRRDICRMERVLECCSENQQVHEAVKRYLRVLQSAEYRERRNLFTLFRGPWNDENKNAIFFQAWEKYGNGRDANRLIATEMGSEVHPNQVAYMKSLYPGWLVYKQMLSAVSSNETAMKSPNSTENQPICAFCQAPNTGDKELDDLGPMIGPLRFAALNSMISSSCSSLSSNSGYYVHRLCALWAPEVFEAYDGTLLNIAQAIQRARQIFCCYCRRKGASLGCKECKRCYHAPKCALLADCYLDTATFQLLCPLHARVEAALGWKHWNPHAS